MDFDKQYSKIRETVFERVRELLSEGHYTSSKDFMSDLSAKDVELGFDFQSGQLFVVYDFGRLYEDNLNLAPRLSSDESKEILEKKCTNEFTFLNELAKRQGKKIMGAYQERVVTLSKNFSSQFLSTGRTRDTLLGRLVQ